MKLTMRPGERTMFKRCRRQWDFAARPRQNLEPVRGSGSFDLVMAVREALAVYYFPGMWEWDRAVVLPLVRKAFERGAAHAGPGLRAEGLALVDAYCDWARRADRFKPVRVENDFMVDVPEPAVARFAGRVQLLVLDPRERMWTCEYRVVRDWTDHQLLLLDEDAAAACWAWHEFWMMDVAGSMVTELRLGGPDRPPAFRRTWIQRGEVELATAWQRLAQEALDMTDPGLRIYPNPSPAHCGPCAYREPCLALDVGEDPAPILAARYRRRPEDQPEEGRLGRGGGTWGLARGPARTTDRERPGPAS